MALEVGDDREAIALLSQAVLVDDDAELVSAILSDNPDSLGDCQQPLLHVACSKGSFDVVAALMQHGADVLGCDARFRRPVHCAVQAKDMDQRVRIVTLLLLEHAKHNDLRRVMLARDKQGCTCMHAAAALPDNSSVVRLLLQHKASAEVGSHPKFPQLQTPLVLACMAGSLETVQELLSAKAYVNASGGGGDGTSGADAVPLICAAKNGWLDGVKALVSAKAYVDARDGEGMTATHWCFLGEHVECARWLVSNAGASMTLFDKAGQTPADLAPHLLEGVVAAASVPTTAATILASPKTRVGPAVRRGGGDVDKGGDSARSGRHHNSGADDGGISDDEGHQTGEEETDERDEGEGARHSDDSGDDRHDDDDRSLSFGTDSSGSESPRGDWAPPCRTNDHGGAISPTRSATGSAAMAAAMRVATNRSQREPSEFRGPSPKVTSRTPVAARLAEWKEQQQQEQQQHGEQQQVRVSHGAASLIQRVRHRLSDAIAFSQTAVIDPASEEDRLNVDVDDGAGSGWRSDDGSVSSGGSSGGGGDGGAGAGNRSRGLRAPQDNVMSTLPDIGAAIARANQRGGTVLIATTPAAASPAATSTVVKLPSIAPNLQSVRERSASAPFRLRSAAAPPATDIPTTRQTQTIVSGTSPLSVPPKVKPKTKTKTKTKPLPKQQGDAWKMFPWRPLQKGDTPRGKSQVLAEASSKLTKAREAASRCRAAAPASRSAVSQTPQGANFGTSAAATTTRSATTDPADSVVRAAKQKKAKKAVFGVGQLMQDAEILAMLGDL
jgi:ankyrin repeat protein